MTTTLDKFHEELDASLEQQLRDIEWRAREAVWWLYVLPLRGRGPIVVEPSYRSWQEQFKLWEAHYPFPRTLVAPARSGKSHALAVAMSDPLSPLGEAVRNPWHFEYPGFAGQRILGNEPWHFEYVAPKLPWWKRLYRAVRRWFR